MDKNIETLEKAMGYKSWTCFETDVINGRVILHGKVRNPPKERRGRGETI